MTAGLTPRHHLLMFEGADGTGKSTCAAAAASGYGKLHHFGIPVASNWYSEWGAVIEHDGKRYRRAVHDRSLFGNAVWDGLIPESPKLIDCTNIGTVANWLLATVQPMVVILTDRHDRIATRLRARGEDDAAIDVAIASSARYHGLADTLALLGVPVTVIPSERAWAMSGRAWWWWA